MMKDHDMQDALRQCGRIVTAIGAIIGFGLSAAASDTPSQADGVEISPHDVVGLWRTPANVLVEIKPCEDSVCGTVVWFPNLEKPGGVVLDINNDDESLRDREIKGMTIIYDFEKKKRGWRKGRIYDPESGESYKSKLTRLTASDLKVQGCVGPVCKTFIWVRQIPDEKEPGAIDSDSADRRDTARTDSDKSRF